MDTTKFTDPETVAGFSRKPVLQKQVENKKYLDLQIPSPTQESLQLEPGDLLEVLIRNHKGQTKFFKKKTSQRTGGLKIYLPREVVKELELNEDKFVDVFISKD